MTNKPDKKPAPNQPLKEDAVRLEHLKNVVEAGFNPYPSTVSRTHTLAAARATEVGKMVSVCGRIVAKREMGKIFFVRLLDDSGRLQVVFSEEKLGKEVFKFAQKNYDLADFISVSGEMFVTQKGETSILATSASVLSKALLPLPEKWHGLQDTEARFRKRYLDLIMNEPVKDRMIKRSKIIASIRQYLDKRNFTEVETPTLQPVYGGGFARPFSTHHNALDVDFYLRISDEMYLKRLIVGGFERVYEITKVFRNEGIDHDHNPEFTMFEAMIAYQDYRFGMDMIEEIVESAALNATGSTEITHGDVVVSVKRPWKRLRVIDAVKEIGGLNAAAWKSLEQAKKELTPHLPPKKVSELDRMLTLGEVVAFAFEELVEEKLIQPTIIYDYPIEVSPLAKKCADPRFTERFEAFALGSEISNNYSELNDPLDLEKRFIEEKKKESAGFDEAHQTDNDYLEAIKHGMPPTCGIALGVDRVVMLLTGSSNIKEVILFPTLRPEHTAGDYGKSKDTLVAHAVLLNTKELPLWSKLNAAAHLSAALGARIGKKLVFINETTTTDGEKIPMNIQHAIMMKETDNAKNLLNLKHSAEEAGLQVTCFTQEMRDSTNDQKVKTIQESKSSSEINWLGVLIFGPKKQVEEITKPFALIKEL